MSKVKDIHDSDLYGVVIETGCGAALTDALTSVSGCGKTLYSAKIPYSKTYEDLLYNRNKAYTRSVSMEFCNAVLYKESNDLDLVKYDSRFDDKLMDSLLGINFIIASSWQMNDGDNDKYTHGWYGIYDLNINKKYFLHYTLSKSHRFTRTETIEKVGKLGVDLLHALRYGTFEQSVADFYTTFILDECYYDEGNGLVTDDETMIMTLERHANDYPLVFDNGKAIRFEDLMRTSEEFILQKGSFNPLHHKHVDMMTLSKRAHPLAKPVFLISSYRWDKPHIDYKELSERIKNINKHGYAVIVCKEVYFYNTFKMLNFIWGKGKMFYFPVGTDTINRIYQTDIAANENSAFKTKIFIEGMIRIYADKFRFMVFPRLGYEPEENLVWYSPLVEYISEFKDDGVSSTKIRNGDIKNEI